MTWDDKAIAKAMGRLLNADYLESHIKTPLQEVFKSLCGQYGLLSKYIDITLLLIFVQIDLLGYLYKGKSVQANAVNFMREYLGRVDERYKAVSGLFYYALRHGYVHLFTPKRIQLNDRMTLDFSFVSFSSSEKHLSVTKREEMERNGPLVICRLLINLTQLYEDLLSAIDKYTEDIRDNQELSDVFNVAFETRRKAEEEKKLLKKPYIHDSGFDFVRKQTSNL